MTHKSKFQSSFDGLLNGQQAASRPRNLSGCKDCKQAFETAYMQLAIIAAVISEDSIERTYVIREIAENQEVFPLQSDGHSNPSVYHPVDTHPALRCEWLI